MSRPSAVRLAVLRGVVDGTYYWKDHSWRQASELLYQRGAMHAALRAASRAGLIDWEHQVTPSGMALLERWEGR